MYELALIEAQREALAQAWSNLQWWASVSFAVIALATFGRERLNGPVVVSISALYVLFSGYAFLNTMLMNQVNVGATLQLTAMRDSGELSQVGLQFLGFADSFGRLGGLLYRICFIATFCAVIIYLWHSYIKRTTRS